MHPMAQQGLMMVMMMTTTMMMMMIMMMMRHYMYSKLKIMFFNKAFSLEPFLNVSLESQLKIGLLILNQLTLSLVTWLCGRTNLIELTL